MRESKSRPIIFSLILIALAIAVYLILPTDEKTEEANLPIPQKNESAKIETQNSNFTKTLSTQDQYERDLENSKNVLLIPKELVKKEVSSGEVFGFVVDNNLASGIDVIRSKSSEEKISIRFTSDFSGELEKVYLYLESKDIVKVRIGIQEDLNGFPSGLWLGDKPGFVETTANLKKNTSESFVLVDNIQITEDQDYHIVIEPVITEEPKEFSMFVYQKNWPFTPFNHMDPDTTKPNQSINTLLFSGSSWSIQNKWPVFVIEYTNGISDGQPYSLMAPWVIKKSSMVGQTVTPFSDYTIKEIAFVVSLEGKPVDDLYYTIYDEQNNILQTGVFATQGELTRKKVWHQVPLETSLSMKAGNIYRFVLSSPQAELKNHYNIFGHEFMLDRSLGYGSVKHYLTKSSDGIQWSKWYDADAAFKLISK